MRKYRKILIGVDPASTEQSNDEAFTSTTYGAIEQALQLGESYQAELTFASVLEFSPQAEALLVDTNYSLSKAQLIQSLESELQLLVQEASQRGVSANFQVLTGSPWKEMTQFATKNAYDLIMVGTRARSGIERFLFGSTNRKLLKSATCDVWVVKEPFPRDQQTLDFCVTSDMSDHSMNLLQCAIDGAQTFDARIHLLHVVENPFKHRMILAGTSPEHLEELHEQEKTQATEQLQQQLEGTDFRTLTYGLQIIVREGRPEMQILKYLDEQPADLLLLGTTERSGLAHFFMGSTAENLVTEINTNLLVMKPNTRSES